MRDPLAEFHSAILSWQDIKGDVKVTSTSV